MIEVYLIYKEDGSTVIDEDYGISKYFVFSTMEEAYGTVVSKHFREENSFELDEKNACIKFIIYKETKDGKVIKESFEVMKYDNYSDFCMHRKSSHTVVTSIIKI